MNCGQCRELLSASLDGENSQAERRRVERLLRTCGCCRGYLDDAARVTRLSRTAVATEDPDLVEAVLSAAPRPRRLPLRRTLRLALGLIGLVQLGVGLTGLFATPGPGATQVAGASIAHLMHESTAWNLALGVGFCWAARHPSRISGLLPTLATFVAVLTGLVLFDLPSGQVGLGRLLMHVWALLGLLLAFVIDRTCPSGKGAPADAAGTCGPMC